MGTSLITIQQGDPIVVEAALFFLGTGSEGDPAAARRLVFPSSVSPLLAPIVYAVGPNAIPLNPSRLLNFDKEPLPHPRTATVETLGSTVAVRFERSLVDVVVTEIWQAGQGASMPSSLFRLLYEYIRNAALIPAGGPYVQWEPRDRSEKTYNVVLLSLSAGSSEDEQRFDIADVRADPRTTGKTLDDALTTLSPLPTGLITTDVTLRFKILSEV